VRAGVHAARTLHLVGNGDGDGKGLGHLGFPLAQVLDALRTPDPPLAVLSLDAVEEPWTILERRLPVDNADLIDMSALSGKLLFERSCLPAPDQLDLHVDGAQVLAIVRAGSEAAGV
jgi:hypothetical protein